MRDIFISVGEPVCGAVRQVSSSICNNPSDVQTVGAITLVLAVVAASLWLVSRR